MSRAELDHRGRPLVAVTGMGMVSALGYGVAENWAALTAGRSGIRAIGRFPTAGLRTTIAGTVDLPHERPGDEIPSSERVRRTAEIAIEEALGTARLGRPGSFPGPLFLGMPPVEVEWGYRFALARAGGPTYPAMTEAAAGNAAMYETCLFGGPAERLAARFGTRGAPISVTTACATGASAIQLAVEAIQRGETEAAIACGADGTVQPESVARFSLLSALSARNDDPAGASRPFERTRDGFVMAEGAAALVLESLASARARGARVLGLVLGCGERADSFHRTRSNPDGAAIIGAMRAALADAHVGAGEVDYVNAHGTGTPENDRMETLGMLAVFGAVAPPISSNKSMTGHSLSAAGAVEAVFSLLTIAHGRLPPTINLAEADPAIPLDVVPNVARDLSVARVLSNSFGFGGQNVCLLLGAEPR